MTCLHQKRLDGIAGRTLPRDAVPMGPRGGFTKPGLGKFPPLSLVPHARIQRLIPDGQGLVTTRLEGRHRVQTDDASPDFGCDVERAADSRPAGCASIDMDDDRLHRFALVP